MVHANRKSIAAAPILNISSFFSPNTGYTTLSIYALVVLLLSRGVVTVIGHFLVRQSGRSGGPS
jgi:hypothetical protein